MSLATKNRVIRIAHSPDPDDAFMFCGLATGAVPSGPYDLVHELDPAEGRTARGTRRRWLPGRTRVAPERDHRGRR